MSSTMGTFEAARSGLNAAQIGLSITSQNISNSSTPGYSRQTINQAAEAPGTGEFKYENTSVRAGQGVDIKSVYQIRNQFLDVRYRQTNAEYNLQQGMYDQLSPIEDTFNVVGNSTTTSNKLTGLSGQLDQLLSDLKTYTASSDSSTISTTIRDDVANLTQMIRSDASKLNQYMDDQMNELRITVNGGAGDSSNGADQGGINGMLDSVKTLNREIASYELNGQQACDLRDQRNLLLDKISKFMDIRTTEQPNSMVTVQLQGYSGTGSGYLIDDTNEIHTMSIGTSGANTVLNWGTGSGIVNVQGGLVKAYLNVMNGDYSGVNDSSTGQCGNLGIPYLEKKLNSLAVAVENIMNNYNYPGATAPELAPGTKFVTHDSTATGLMNVAETISISSEWSKTPEYFVNSFTGTSKSDYFNAFINTLKSTTGTVADQTTSPSSTYSGTLRGYADSIYNELATSMGNIKQNAEDQKTIVDDIDQQRQSVSSVSTNDEGVNIIKYQQAYNASSRIITTIDEMLDKLINGTAV